MSNLDIPPQEWLEHLFEDEYCEECSGDAIHHTAIPFLGNWFARCDYPPDNEGNPHPIIVEYRRLYDDYERQREAALA